MGKTQTKAAPAELPLFAVQVVMDPGDWDGSRLYERVGAWFACWRQANPWNPWTHGKDMRITTQSQGSGTLYYVVDCQLIADRGDEDPMIGLLNVCEDHTEGVLSVKPAQVPDKNPNVCFDPPTVTAVNPASGPVAGGTSVTITGTNFTPNSNVFIGALAATDIDVVSETSITCKSAAGSAGPADVTVVSAGGPGTKTGAFTYLAAPTLATVAPSSGTENTATSVTLTGTGFVAPVTVKFGAVAATDPVVVSPTSVTCKTPANVAASTVDVTVTAAGGTVVKTGGFEYTAAGG